MTSRTEGPWVHSNLASSVISAFSTFDTGQFAFAPAASSWNLAASMPRHARAQHQMHRGDLPARTFLLHGQCRIGVQAVRRMARAAELKCRRHAEAAGMRGGDQFLGVGALAVAEARVERIRRVLQRRALRGEAAFAVLAAALPLGAGVTLDLPSRTSC